METLHYIRKTDLARQTRKVIRDAQRGMTVVVENHGQAEVAIIDILDYQILRAVMRFYADPVEMEPGAGLAAEALADLDLLQQVEVTMTHYLAGAISLSRAAELLGVPWLDLRTRFLRLDVPLRQGPADSAEARAEIEEGADWLDHDQDH
jgi:predicted HTH domain antitoxin